MPIIVTVLYRYPERFETFSGEPMFLESLDELVGDICKVAGEILNRQVAYSIDCADPEREPYRFCSSNFPTIVMTAEVPNSPAEDLTDLVAQIQNSAFGDLKDFVIEYDENLKVYCWWKVVDDQYPTFA